MLASPSPLLDALWSPSPDTAFCMCLRMAKKGVSIRPGIQIQPFGAHFHVPFVTFYYKVQLLQIYKTCNFAKVTGSGEHFLLFISEACNPTCTSLFNIGFLAALAPLWLSNGLPFGHAWRGKFFPSPPALLALANGNVSPRVARGVPIGFQEPSDGFKSSE